MKGYGIEGILNHNVASHNHQQMSLMSQFTAPSLTYAPYSLCIYNKRRHPVNSSNNYMK